MGEDVLTALNDAVSRGRLSATAAASTRQWLTGEEYQAFRGEIAAKLRAGDLDELEDAFCRMIPFGTAGQRGPTGAGPNRINAVTITRSVQGVCDYVGEVKPGTELRSVVAYDTRRDSARFAVIVAEVLVGNGLRVDLFEAPRPTPELSHAVVRLKADLGFMVSASHNPPNDNGIKVYWDYGGQVLPEHAEGITRKTATVGQVTREPLGEARARGRVRAPGRGMDEAFRAVVLAEGLGTPGGPLASRLVFTPLHGTGMDSVLPVLEASGWRPGENLFIVESQRDPDPEFRGVPGGIPNPENPESLSLGVDLAKSVGADLVLASDPDADRLAAAVRESRDGDRWYFPQGGQLASLLAWWALSQMAAQGKLPERALAARSIITSDLVDAVAESFGVEVVNNLPVGFKYIGKVISEVEGTGRFVFGAEQSYGFVKGVYCRDKDAAIAALLLAELTEDLKRSGRTPVDLLRRLWVDHGYHAERATPVRMEGVQGRRRIEESMGRLRERFPSELGGLRVTEVWDLLSDAVTDPLTGTQTRELGWQWGEDVLIGRLEGDAANWVAVRPSGTEPSLKVYTNIRRTVAGAQELDGIAASAESRAQTIEADALSHMGLGAVCSPG